VQTVRPIQRDAVSLKAIPTRASKCALSAGASTSGRWVGNTYSEINSASLVLFEPEPLVEPLKTRLVATEV
jgi:hypothetical protein